MIAVLRYNECMTGGQEIEIERKFLLKKFPDLGGVQLGEVIDTHQVYLKSSDPNVEVRLRTRTVNGKSTYILTRKRRISPGVREEHEEELSPEEWRRLYDTERDLNSVIIDKVRYCLPWKGHMIEIDQYRSPINLSVAEVELQQLGEHLDLPPFLEIEREVTNDERYSNANIAKGSLSAVSPERAI